MTYFHGTDNEIDFTADNPTRGRFDICFTDDADVAAGYGETVHAVDLSVVPSTAEEVVEIADAHDLNGEGCDRIEADSPYFYLLIDEPAVQDALEAEGIHAVEYDDEDWDNVQHTCIRVFFLTRHHTLKLIHTER